MVNRSSLFAPRPLTALDMLRTSSEYDLIIPQDVYELEADVENVFGGIIDINTFPPERRELIKAYYRFSAKYNSNLRKVTNDSKLAKRCMTTLDPV